MKLPNALHVGSTLCFGHLSRQVHEKSHLLGAEISIGCNKRERTAQSKGNKERIPEIHVV
jgi:hypothetical protein